MYVVDCRDETTVICNMSIAYISEVCKYILMSTLNHYVNLVKKKEEQQHIFFILLCVDDVLKFFF